MRAGDPSKASEPPGALGLVGGMLLDTSTNRLELSSIAPKVGTVPEAVPSVSLR